ncbi:MAG: DUF4168 domain-containing protein [Paracoccaceae bacterium]
MQIPRTVAAALAAGFLAAAMPTVLPAQDQPAQTEVSENELDAFIVAYENVSEVGTQYDERLRAAEDEAAQQEVLQEAEAAMVEVIEETPGIDLDRYVEILDLAQTDQELNARIMEELNG